ncbi:hypothetical protein J2S78_000077 [Salibacterium salarium]|nr:hypothetical protein [Salibacterium salarium]
MVVFVCGLAIAVSFVAKLLCLKIILDMMKEIGARERMSFIYESVETNA